MIEIAQGHKVPPTDAEVIVVIDVIRAFTATLSAFASGVEEILLTSSHEEAFRLRDEKGATLAGERKGLPIEGYDYGNSPADLSQLQGVETLVLNTTNGVTVALSALDRNPKYCLAAGLASARPIARYISSKKAKNILLVASHPTGDEDVAVAEYLKSLLEGRPLSVDDVKSRILNSEAACKFKDSSRPEFKAADLDYCVKDQELDFVQVVLSGAYPKLVKEGLP